MEEECFYNRNRDDIFHPFSNNNDNKYFPEETLTKQFVLIKLIWEDIFCLAEIARVQKDIHKKKALLKYIYMDLCSLYDKFVEFKCLIIETTDIDCLVQKQILVKFNEFLSEISDFGKGAFYRKLRNKLSAHRDREILLTEAKGLWESIDDNKLMEVKDKIRAFYIYLKGLDNELNYRWARDYQEGGMKIKSIVQPLRIGEAQNE
ncbi:hypothetical protein A3J90_06215 [candidate division WOR-1 bacterium RIFOXYC2_FULL_37_10]|uniref:HEPN AbiU2-like domain-containing protein n=1 Tax=candidate division WOR-1 bacterium RIFOXYB2_FULL_37_13 TaxID=1802579 RepID=A0A1F4SW86_UNCSA|nr:MAG: hypothetical protein A2246_05210 [candidate division WOR-1 bacterium RIFOXYA2_FULL_37_7]OGC24714.1 MAG: hypothetical protein A2310_04435 [candidate division WOR-1 bacterium RIFOXYB2_FULL_37_13]OGC34825.1 MAG: hypothetical protein A3J90_06215 [candidate division WOR-1 bacterium RIFOXYC2_FULL_37_10]